MKNLTLIFFSGVCAVALSACEPASTPAAEETGAQSMPMEMDDTTDMPDQAMGTMESDTGRATGSIVSINADGGSVTIDHGSFEGISMGAMTMNFALMGDADLTGFSEGDQVSFEVKRGRDGSYRIMQICEVDESGADCLAD